MTACYTAGRLPQLWRTYQRKSTAGLSLAMFAMVVGANATYAGSILVHSLEWRRLRPRLPWLTDALLCLALDIIILAQFYIYRTSPK